MLKNYLLTSLRNFRKNKSYIIINAFGLGIALACCISAYIILAFNIEFDDAFADQDLDRMFRIHTEFVQPDGALGQHITAPMVMGPAMAQDIAGVERFTRYNAAGGFVQFGDHSFSESVRFADSTFFEMFEFRLVKGSFDAFKKLDAVILSKETARKYFNNDNPIGQVLTFHFPNQKEINAVVGAVYENSPQNSSLHFGLMMRIEHFNEIYDLGSGSWADWRDAATFVELSNPERANEIPALMGDYIQIRNEKKPDAKVAGFKLEPFMKPINQDDVNWSMINLRMSIVPLLVFSVMALLILLIACFNLTNTSFAITARRLKEVGIRKVIGASRQHIIAQFLFEMVLTILISLVVGLVMAKFIAAEFSDMWNLGYGMDDLNGLNLFIALIILVFVASLIAGLYPAMANSRFMPVQLLKSNVKIKGTNWFTKTLVMLQFAISVFVLINGIIFTQNTKFQESINYGFDMNVLIVPISSESDFTILNNQTKSYPKITQTAISHHQLGWSSYPFPVAVDTTEYSVQHIEVGQDFFETMGLHLIEGRFLNMRNAQDRTDAIVVNRAFVEHTGMKDPLSQYVSVRDKRMRVVGVIENHVDNLFRSREAEPFVFYGSKPNEYQMMLVKGNQSDLGDIKDYMSTIWKKNFPERPFEATFQEDAMLGGIRETNTNLKKIFLFLTVLGGLLSISGIYAMASLNVEKRTKEIGVRKVLGASVSYLIGLLSREFAVILGIAALIGSLGGFYLSAALLDEIYAYHISVGIWPLIAGSLVIFIMGIATTSWIIGKAATSNPVESLRDE